MHAVAASAAMSSVRLPRLLVFDLDACLWTPEMFELSSAPTKYDAAAGGVRAGSECVHLFPGALAVLRRLTDPAFSAVKIAVASSTTEPAFAATCLEQLVVTDEPRVTVADLVDYRQIYPANKGRRHFPALQRESNIPFSEMIFFDDCTYGDNCRDVSSACAGVLSMRTPSGLDERAFDDALKAFAEGKTGVLR